MILKPEELFNACDPTAFSFATTADLNDSSGVIGQERALSALDFGLELGSEGFNIFVLGDAGTGKTGTVKALCARKALSEPVPSDWCYVYNFNDPDAPIAIALKPGEGPVFAKDMEELVSSLRAEIPKAFDSKEYEKQRSKIIEDFQQKQKQFFISLEEETRSRGFAIRKATAGLIIVPIKESGEPITEEEFNALDENTRNHLEETGRMLQERLDDIARAVREAEKIVREMIGRLEREIALGAIGPHIGELAEHYRSNPSILSYLESVREDILSNIGTFKGGEETPPPLPFMKMPKPELSLARYTVNVIVSNAGREGAPVVFESNPTYLNLFGKVEYKVQYGMAVTDFTMIRAGSLHRANSGYLIINAMDLLKNIFSYDALKRALRNREIRIEDAWEQYRLVSTAALKPEPIPLAVKAILIGNPFLYYLLRNYDEEYRELFKVKSDFDSDMQRNEETTAKFASFIAAACREEKLLPVTAGGVARVVEHASRLAEHQNKLTARLGDISDLLRESHYRAKKSGSLTIDGEHVGTAIRAQALRANRFEDRLREMTIEDTIIVRTSGEAVGQVNGLAVLDMGDYRFGKPSRITARTYTGKAGVINIERETKMSGRIHNKAIMIITHYLGGKYASKKPLTLSASITFEQLYEMVEGDSASCAEFIALLSSISGIPLKQGFAITGSMDQNGDVQPIGGVNEKIEGFFDLCAGRGLDGSQGVIIPRRNIRHLMLKPEVVDAVREERFFVHAIEHVEEGLEIMTGMEAGLIQEDGSYPDGTVNACVVKRLDEISSALEKRKDTEPDKGKTGQKDESSASCNG